MAAPKPIIITANFSYPAGSPDPQPFEITSPLPAASLPAATASVAGTVKRGVAVPNAAAGTEVATINALLASLRTAGAIAP